MRPEDVDRVVAALERAPAPDRAGIVEHLSLLYRTGPNARRGRAATMTASVPLHVRLLGGRASVPQIAEVIGVSYKAASRLIGKAERAGLVRRLARGVYGLPEGG